MTKNSGIIVTCTGTIMVRRIAEKIRFFPRNFISANTKPASEQVTTWPSADRPEITRLFSE